MVLFIGLQIYVLNNVPPLHQFISPVIYYLFLLWLPFSVSRLGLLFLGFLLGLSIDYFLVTPGLNTAVCLAIAYVRPFLISVLIPHDKAEFNFREPSAVAMGWVPYITYVMLLSFLFHGYISFLEWLQWGSFFDFILKTISATLISTLLAITSEVLFARKGKVRSSLF